MRTLFNLISIVIPMHSFAATLPNFWKCSIDGPSKPGSISNQVLLSLREPEVIEIRYAPNTDGTYRISKNALMTDSHVSEWGEKKLDCQTKGQFRESAKGYSYEFTFNCKKAKGEFSINFTDGTGYYKASRVSPKKARALSLHNCYSTKW